MQADASINLLDLIHESDGNWKSASHPVRGSEPHCFHRRLNREA